MNFYSLGQLSNSEKSDILNKHKEIYNGYRKVWEPVANEQPLYTQDFANDKEGLVVTNKGNVKAYTNYGINEQTETNEIDVKDLMKGKKYKYQTPAFEDDIEFEREVTYPQGSEHYSFKGDKGHGHLMGKSHIEDYLSDVEEGIYDVQKKFTGKFDYTEEEMREDVTDDDAFAKDSLSDYTGQEPTHDADDMAPDGMDDDSDYDRKMMGMTEEDEYEVMTSSFEDMNEITGPGPNYSEIEPAYDFVSDGPMQEDELEEGFFDYSNDEEFEDLYDYDEKETAFDRLRRRPDDVEDIDFEEIEDSDIRESLIKQKNKINEMFSRMSRYN
jgi:hypothetical protein